MHKVWARSSRQQDTSQQQEVVSSVQNAPVEYSSYDEDYHLEWLETPFPKEMLDGDESEVCLDPESHCHHHLPKVDSKLVATESSRNLAAKKAEIRKATENSFYPVTMELRPDSVHDFLLAAEETSEGNFQSEQPFCLTGLHTCGDLCSTALKLFAGIHSARALCVVGCCYHHITETVDKEGEVVSVDCIIINTK